MKITIKKIRVAVAVGLLVWLIGCIRMTIEAEETDTCVGAEYYAKGLVVKKEGAGTVFYDDNFLKTEKLAVSDVEGNCYWLTTESPSTDCYIATGIGFENVTVTRIENESCNEIRWVEFVIKEGQEPTPTPRECVCPTWPCCATKTPSPTPTDEPEPTETPTLTPSPSLTKTPSLTPSPTDEPKPTNTPEPGPTNTPQPGPTNTPEPGPTNTPGPESTNTPEPNPTATSIPATPTSQPAVGGGDNDNPLVEAIEAAFGGFVLGAKTELPSTGGEILEGENLPSGNKQTGERMVIESLGIEEDIFEAKKIGQMEVIGQGEIVESEIAGKRVLMGHNWGGALEKLYRIEAGSDIKVGDEVFEVAEKFFVDKEEIEIVNKGKGDDLFLITCSVTNPDKRIVVRAIKI